MRFPGRLRDHITSRRIPISRRLTLASALAVAVAIALASGVTYFAVRAKLYGEIDSSLRDRAMVGETIAEGPGPIFMGGSLPPETTPPPNVVSRLGGAEGAFQILLPSGATIGPGDTKDTRVPVTPADKAVAGGGDAIYYDATVNGQRIRVFTQPVQGGGAVMAFRPLNEVDSTLHSLILILVAITAGGIAVAVVLGRAVSSASLAPVREFTSQTEEIAHDQLAGRRLPVEGDDELARLADSYNSTLTALETSVAAQRQLVSDASHELRTPLASMRANAELLVGDGLVTAERREAAAAVVEQADELKALVEDVVELARSGESEPRMSDVRLDQVVREAVERARRHSPNVDFDVGVGPTVLRGVPDRLGRAVSNLLDNAVKWSPDGGRVDVRLGDGVLSVRDRGPGFAREDLPHVFDRFYRAGDARSKPGSGLGLAIVRQVVEAHGGNVSAANAPGGGAVLRARFPDAAPVAHDLG
jgi:two-component system, OmpR family, sensor histidine kinase MprB